MDPICTFAMSWIPPPKKNRYRIGKKRLWHRPEIAAAINACTEEFRHKWSGRPPILDPVHAHVTIHKRKKLPDSINILETLYDCLEKAGVILNDSQIQGWSGWTLIKPKTDILITIELYPIPGDNK